MNIIEQYPKGCRIKIKAGAPASEGRRGVVVGWSNDCTCVRVVFDGGRSTSQHTYSYKFIEKDGE